MNLIDFLTSPVANALGWTLFHALWQGFAIVLPTAVILHLLRHWSSALRYQVGVLALPGQLLVSMATFWVYYQPKVSVSLSSTYAATVMRPLPVRWQVLTQTLPWHQQVQQFMESHLSQFVFVYLIGIAIFGLRLAGGWLYLQRLSHAAVEPASNTLINLTGKLRVALSLRVVVQVRESARIAVPMVVGTLKPVLLLPISLVTNLSMREIEAVLAHELAHVKRHDYAVNLLQSVMEVLYFFHPALWWLSARIREEREHCCDDLAMQACGGNGRALAQALARVEELRNMDNRSTPALAMALSSGRQLLLHRVRRMLGVATQPMVSNGSLAGLTLATLLLVSASVYAIQREQPTPKPRTSQAKHTRRHKVAKGTELGFSEDRKITYVTWKGKKLPATHITRLQRQLDQVMAGQLSLDDVKQPDRDILLAIIETNAASSVNTSAIQESLAHIDYENVVASALDNVAISLDDTAERPDTVDYETIMKEAFASIPKGTLSFEIDSLPDNDQVSRLWTKETAIKARMQEQQRALESIFDQMKEPIKLQQSLEQERFQLQRQALFLNNQVKRLEFESVKKVLLDEIAGIDTKVSELNKRIGNLQIERKPYLNDVTRGFKKMRVLMDSMRINEKQIFELSTKIGYQEDPSINPMIDMSTPETPEVIERPEHAPKPPRLPKVITGTPAPARAPRLPKAVRGAIVPLAPASPRRIVDGEVIPATPAIPPRPNARVSVPQPAPRPATAPTPAAVPEPPK